MTAHPDVVIVGAGLSGLVAACELLDADRRVTLVDQESRRNLGGQAFWSFGGLFLVDSPEQRRMGIRDSRALAWRDWLGPAGFDRPDDAWPRRWAEAYVDWAAGEKRGWLRERGIRFFPVVGWAERGGGLADGPGNSVPRFHVTWGTGPGLVEPFARRVEQAVRDGRLHVAWRHKVTELLVESGSVVGIRGDVLAPSDAPRGAGTTREVVDDFEFRAGATIVAAGGIGANVEMVRACWPVRLGPPPERLVSGVPEHVDGSMLEIAESAGARWIHRDRMWHYTEGIRNWDPVWRDHGIRVLPGPSTLRLDATGRHLPPPFQPRIDTLANLPHIGGNGHD
ncbi:MAG: FAD-binding dehydrogenase, partial [Longimicrobiales bacterium]